MDPFAALDGRARERLRPQGHPPQVEAMLATLVDEPFSDPDWLYERKLDGMRLLVHRRGGDVWLETRNHGNRTGGFPELAEAVGALETRDLVADGEVVAFEGAVSSFEPELVAEIEFTEWTQDDRLRHPRYEGLRPRQGPRRRGP